MAFTSREEYGLRALIHLALYEGRWPIQTREIAASEGIPEQFLEHILATLRRAGIVRSVRGAFGGYELARPARNISAGEVVRALGGSVLRTPCADGGSPPDRCRRIEHCAVASLWQKTLAAISDVLDSTTIQDLVDEQMRKEESSSYMMHI